jgi:hypothetical protein
LTSRPTPVRRLLAAQSERADIRLACAGAHGLVYGLDDVGAGTELAQRRFEAQRPAGGSDTLGQTEALQLCHAAQHE